MKIKVVQTPRIKIVNPAPPPAELTVYPVGPRGEPGPGVPAGGTAGQVLKKVDGTDYNTAWQNEAGASPVVGLSQVAFGDPITGALTSSPYFTFTNDNFVYTPFISFGNSGGNAIVKSNNGTLLLFANQPYGNGIFIEDPGTVSIFTSYVTNPKVVVGTNYTRINSGNVATDTGVRIDQYGVRIGQYSSLGTSNTTAFEVEGLGVYPNGIVSSMPLVHAFLQLKDNALAQIGYFSTRTQYFQYQLDTYVNAALLTSFTATNYRFNLLAGTGNRRVHVNASGDLVATEPAFDVVNEVPSGLINGSNATFTTAGNFVPGTEEVYLNGLKLVKLEDYNTTGTNQIDLYVSPGVGEHLIVNYKKI